MIDLKQLEKDIDVLLEQETTDSLLSWLYEKEIKDLKIRLGEGVFDAIPVNEDHLEFAILIEPITSKMIGSSDITEFTTFCTAA